MVQHTVLGLIYLRGARTQNFVTTVNSLFAKLS